MTSPETFDRLRSREILGIALALLMSQGLAGCLLPDFENEPYAQPGGTDGGLPDVAGDGTSEKETGEGDTTSEGEPDVEPDVELPFCEAHEDGTVCGTGDACTEMVCQSGECVLVDVPDGAECADAPSACHQPGLCSSGVCTAPKAYPDGHNWDPSNTWARCCNAQPLLVNTNTHCGVCGIQCDTSDGQSCKLNSVNQRYYCEGCKTSAKCWSGCCSMSYGEPYRCAASDCQGNCINCPSGASCVTSSQASNVCAYD